MEKKHVFFLLVILSSLAFGQNNTSAPDPAGEIMNRINEVVCQIVVILQYLAAGIAALMIILAGMRFLSAGDDPALRNKAKNIIIYAFAGLALVIVACPLVDYIVENTDIVPFTESCDCILSYHWNATEPTPRPPRQPTTTYGGGGPVTSSTTNPGGGGGGGEETTSTTSPQSPGYECGALPSNVCSTAEAQSECSLLSQLGSDCRQYCCDTYGFCC